MGGEGGGREEGGLGGRVGREGERVRRELGGEGRGREEGVLGERGRKGKMDTHLSSLFLW